MRIFAYIGETFSSTACASFARWATTATLATGCWALVHLVRLNHQLPGAVDLVALAAWMTAPYSINKVAAVLSQPETKVL